MNMWTGSNAPASSSSSSSSSNRNASSSSSSSEAYVLVPKESTSQMTWKGYLSLANIEPDTSDLIAGSIEYPVMPYSSPYKLFPASGESSSKNRAGQFNTEQMLNLELWAQHDRDAGITRHLVRATKSFKKGTPLTFVGGQLLEAWKIMDDYTRERECYMMRADVLHDYFDYPRSGPDCALLMDKHFNITKFIRDPSFRSDGGEGPNVAADLILHKKARVFVVILYTLEDIDEGAEIFVSRMVDSTGVKQKEDHQNMVLAARVAHYYHRYACALELTAQEHKVKIDDAHQHAQTQAASKAQAGRVFLTVKEQRLHMRGVDPKHRAVPQPKEISEEERLRENESAADARDGTSSSSSRRGAVAAVAAAVPARKTSENERLYAYFRAQYNAAASAAASAPSEPDASADPTDADAIAIVAAVTPAARQKLMSLAWRNIKAPEKNALREAMLQVEDAKKKVELERRVHSANSNTRATVAASAAAAQAEAAGEKQQEEHTPMDVDHGEHAAAASSSSSSSSLASFITPMIDAPKMLLQSITSALQLASAAASSSSSSSASHVEKDEDNVKQENVDAAAASSSSSSSSSSSPPLCLGGQTSAHIVRDLMKLVDTPDAFRLTGCEMIPLSSWGKSVNQSTRIALSRIEQPQFPEWLIIAGEKIAFNKERMEELLDGNVGYDPDQLEVREILSLASPCRYFTMPWWRSFAVVSKADLEIGDLLVIYSGEMEQEVQHRCSSYVYNLPTGEGVSHFGKDYGAVPGLIIDAENKGNIGRFINDNMFRNGEYQDASASNIGVTYVFARSMPHLVFYAKKRIKQGEELISSYGSDFWDIQIKQNLTGQTSYFNYIRPYVRRIEKTLRDRNIPLPPAPDVVVERQPLFEAKLRAYQPPPESDGEEDDEEDMSSSSSSSKSSSKGMKKKVKDEEEEFTVENIVGKRFANDTDGDSSVRYLVKWLHYDLPTDLSWEPLKNLDNSYGLIGDFERKLKRCGLEVGVEPLDEPAVPMQIEDGDVEIIEEKKEGSAASSSSSSDPLGAFANARPRTMRGSLASRAPVKKARRDITANEIANGRIDLTASDAADELAAEKLQAARIAAESAKKLAAEKEREKRARANASKHNSVKAEASSSLPLASAPSSSSSNGAASSRKRNSAALSSSSSSSSSSDAIADDADNPPSRSHRRPHQSSSSSLTSSSPSSSAAPASSSSSSSSVIRASPLKPEYASIFSFASKNATKQ